MPPNDVIEKEKKILREKFSKFFRANQEFKRKIEYLSMDNERLRYNLFKQLDLAERLREFIKWRCLVPNYVWLEPLENTNVSKYAHDMAEYAKTELGIDL